MCSSYKGLSSGSHHRRIHVGQAVDEDNSSINVDKELRYRDLHDAIATEACESHIQRLGPHCGVNGKGAATVCQYCVPKLIISRSMFRPITLV